MSAQTPYLEVDAIGVLPTVIFFLVLVPHGARDRRPRRVRLTRRLLPPPREPRPTGGVRASGGGYRAGSSIASPGATTRTGTSGREAAARLGEAGPGVSNGAGTTRRSPAGRTCPSGSASRAAAAGVAAAAAGALRVHVPLPDRRAPAPDGQQRDVQRPGQLVHRGEQVRVAGEVDRPRARGRRTRSPGPSGPNGSRFPEWSAPGPRSSCTRSIVSRSPGSTSSTGPRPHVRAISPNPRGTMTVGLPGIRRSDGWSRWSWWPWLMNTASRSANSSGQHGVGPGAGRARSPRAGPGR